MYGDLSKLQIANLYFELGRKDDAASVLQNLADARGSVPQLKTIAMLKLASYKIDNNDPAEEIRALLNPLIEDGDNKDIAQELSAMLAIREKDFGLARTEYQKIIASETASDELKARAHDIINILND